MSYEFLNEEENNKSGTIFTLTGKIWGYDITLFNYFNENEILIEPERKFIIDEVLPPINGIIHIRCDIQDNPLVLIDISKKKEIKNYDNSIQILEDASSSDYYYLLKFLIIGDPNTGKTDIIRKFIKNNNNNIIVRKKIYKIQIWDTTGAERFRSFLFFHYKGSDVAIFVYNINDRKSFENIQIKIKECQDLINNKEISRVLVGNKFELVENREVTCEEGKLLANKYGIQFYEISCQTGENINEIFYNSINEIATKIEKGIYNLNGKIYNKRENINKVEEKKNESGCIIL